MKVKYLFFFITVSMLGLGIFSNSMSFADRYPDRPIQVVIPNVPGSVMDINARVLSDELGKLLGTQIIVITKPGAATTLGTDAVARSKKDGYTLVYTGASATIYTRITNPETVPYDPIKDLEPLGLHLFLPLTVTVQENSPWKTFGELVDYAKKNPGKLRVSTIGVGGIDHFNMEITQAMTGAQFTHVPFKGGEAVITALLGGHVEVTYDAFGKILPHAQAGKLRILLLTKKMSEYPHIPTATELGYKQGLLSGWFAFYGPAGLPEEVKKILIPAIEKVIKNPELKAKVEKMGFVVDYKSPAELKKLVIDEYETANAIAIKIGLRK
jgi:tripartite-type tricarboxylate transporter receptor subunit TctC